MIHRVCYVTKNVPAVAEHCNVSMSTSLRYGLATHSAHQEMSFTLYGYEAAAEGIELDQVEVIPREGIGKTEYLSKFPLSRGKIPGLEGPDGLKLTETLAITT
ncbi:MAG: hypothetical protein LQ346_007918, partial [Caloplaca aetnensis]